MQKIHIPSFVAGVLITEIAVTISVYCFNWGLPQAMFGMVSSTFFWAVLLWMLSRK